MSLACSSPGCRRSGAEEVLGEIRVALLECKVCFESFGGRRQERRPRNLPCGHVLCRDCLAALSHPVLRSLECPFCRQPCNAGDMSDCLPLLELCELLRASPGPPHAPPLVGRAAAGPGGLAVGALHLRSAFGGWGTLLNPTAVAVSSSSETVVVVVVHDGERRVMAFSPQGQELHGFGQKGCSPSEISHPLGVAVAPGGNVVVTDAGNGTVKVFTSRGRCLVTVRELFQLPWGVAVDGRGHILVTDAQAGTLSRVVVDFGHAVVTLTQVVCAELQCPKSVACCPATGNIAVVEHLAEQAKPGSGYRPTRLSLFSRELSLLSQMDTFGLSLVSPVRLSISAVAFDRDGDFIVADLGQAIIWSLGKSPSCPVLTPLVSQGLVHPVGLAVTPQNVLVVLDGGDHAVKVFDATATQQ